MPQESARVEQVEPDTLEVARRERVLAPAQLLIVRMDLVAALVVELVEQVVEPVQPAVVQVVRSGQAVLAVARAVQVGQAVLVAARVVLSEEEPDRSVPDWEGCSSYLVLSRQLARKG